MEFAVIGKLKRSKDEIKLNIMRLGGKISSKVHDFTTAVICSQSNNFLLNKTKFYFKNKKF